MYKKAARHHYETSNTASYVSGLIAVLLFISIMIYYVYRGQPFNLAFSNRALAITSAVLIGLSFVIGPLSRFFPKSFVPKLEYRKPFGILGYLFAVGHILLSLLIVDSSVYASSQLSLVSGMLAILIFSFVSASSLVKSIQAFGFERWQQIQRLGYLAYVLVIIHFSLVGGGQFLGRQLGQILITFALLVLALRVIVLFMGKPKK